MGVDPEPRLELLHHDVEVACAKLGYELDGRPFRPHLTIGRGATRGSAAERASLRTAAKKVRFTDEFLVQSIDVMQSVPGAGRIRLLGAVVGTDEGELTDGVPASAWMPRRAAHRGDRRLPARATSGWTGFRAASRGRTTPRAVRCADGAGSLAGRPVLERAHRPDAPADGWTPLTEAGAAAHARRASAALSAPRGPVFVTLSGSDVASYVFLQIAKQMPASTDSFAARVDEDKHPVAGPDEDQRTGWERRFGDRRAAA